jgi:hypothetical protein
VLVYGVRGSGKTTAVVKAFLSGRRGVVEWIMSAADYGSATDEMHKNWNELFSLWKNPEDRNFEDRDFDKIVCRASLVLVVVGCCAMRAAICAKDFLFRIPNVSFFIPSLSIGKRHGSSPLLDLYRPPQSLTVRYRNGWCQVSGVRFDVPYLCHHASKNKDMDTTRFLSKDPEIHMNKCITKKSQCGFSFASSR